MGPATQQMPLPPEIMQTAPVVEPKWVLHAPECAQDMKMAASYMPHDLHNASFQGAIDHGPRPREDPDQAQRQQEPVRPRNLTFADVEASMASRNPYQHAEEMRIRQHQEQQHHMAMQQQHMMMQQQRMVWQEQLHQQQAAAAAQAMTMQHHMVQEPQRRQLHPAETMTLQQQMAWAEQHQCDPR